ncbi:MAG: ParA family protein [Pseudomonadota bacterium]
MDDHSINHGIDHDVKSGANGNLRIFHRAEPRTVLVANAKGGCGKTTLASNLAAWFAGQGKRTALMDFDPQGSSAYWLKLRPESLPTISGIAAYGGISSTETRSFRHRLPRDVERVVVDSPAGLSGTDLYHRISDADLILVPILPSPIDIHSAANFIKEIQLTGSLREQNKQLLVIANRVRRNTVMFAKLNAFLTELRLPRITYTRDSQLYTRAAAQGRGIADLPGKTSADEKAHWQRIGGWIEHQLTLRNSHRQQARHL